MTLAEVMASLDPAERAAVEARFKELADELRATDVALGDYTVNLIRTLPEAAAKLRAEHDALRAEVERLRMAEAEAMAVVYSLEGTVERLRAELAKPCVRCHCMDRAIEKMGDPREGVSIRASDPTTAP